MTRTLVEPRLLCSWEVVTRARNPKLRRRVTEVQRGQALPPIWWLDELEPWQRAVVRHYMRPPERLS